MVGMHGTHGGVARVLLRAGARRCKKSRLQPQFGLGFWLGAAKRRVPLAFRGEESLTGLGLGPFA